MVQARNHKIGASRAGIDDAHLPWGDAVVGLALGFGFGGLRGGFGHGLNQKMDL